MKKYYLQCLAANAYDRVYLLLDLQEPRYYYGFLEFKLIGYTEDAKIWCTIDDGYCDIDDNNSIGAENKLLEFESDDDAKLWFEITYGNNK